MWTAILGSFENLMMRSYGEAASVTVTEDKRARSAKGHSKPSRRYSWAFMPVLASIASLMLLGPLARVSILPILSFLAAATVFMIPGLILTRLCLRDVLTGVARLPVGFALSTGVFGFPGVLALLLHRSMESYLLACGGILVLSLALAVLVAFKRPPSGLTSEEPESTPIRLLGLPFLLFGALLALASILVEHQPGTDIWSYLASVADFSERDGLGLYNSFSGTENVTFNRMLLSGWLLEQAALSNVTGIAHIELVLNYLAPALVGLSLLAFYSLALTLFENRSTALLAGVLYTLFFLTHLGPDQTTMGGEFVALITEDKFISRFVHLPVALAMAVLFVRERRWRYLALFAFVFWATGVVHPLLMAIVAICLTGFGLVHLLLSFRQRDAWKTLGALLAVPSLTILPPALYLITTGNVLLNKFEAEASLAAPRIEAAQASGRLLVLKDGSYVMDPALLLDPVVAASYVLGVPFLIWRARTPSAQLLLGTMLLVPALIYVPVVATFISQFVGPWSLWRLAWPIPLASVLVLGWIFWFALGFVSDRLRGTGLVSRLAPVLPLVLLLVLTIGAAAPALEGFRAADQRDKTGQEDGTCGDPAFSFLGEVVERQVAVLVDDSVGGCVAANASKASILAYRTADGGTDQAPASFITTALNEFFDSPTLDEGDVQFIQGFEVEYVLLPLGSPMNEQLRYSPGFEALDTPGRRYKLYGVDQAKLETKLIHKANLLLESKELDTAVPFYTGVIETAGQGEAYLAYVGLGQAYSRQGLDEEAIKAYKQATVLEPKEPHPYELLARSYADTGNTSRAVSAHRKAVSLAPDDVELRQRFGALLEKTDRDEALKQYRAVVEMYPRVPEYRADLGAALFEAGKKGEGEKQMQRAISLSPLSARIRGVVAEVYADAGNLPEAVKQYERARELYPGNQGHALRLGEVYVRLAERKGGEEYVEKAEDTLQDAIGLAGPGQERQEARALIALGNVYAEQGRKEEAAARYEEAQKVAPDLPSARNALKKLEKS